MDYIKAYFQYIEIQNARFALYYDSEFKKLHLLDWNDPGTRSVTNAVNVDFFVSLDNIIYSMIKARTNFTFDIYLYGTDGMISEYEPDSGKFSYFHPADPHLYEKFKNISAKRFFEATELNRNGLYPN